MHAHVVYEMKDSFFEVYPALLGDSPPPRAIARGLVQEASEDRESRVVRSRMEELVARVQPDALKKPGFAIIQDVPCRITEINHKPKATANGNKRLHLVGTHIHTGKKYEDTLNLSAGFHGINVPVTSKATFALCDVDASTGFLSLLTDDGETKEDVSLTRAEDGGFDALGAEVVQRFEAGESLKVTVLSIMGQDMVDGVAKDMD